MENAGLFEGDIALNPKANTFGSMIGGRWPNGIIPYEIDPVMGNKARTAIKEAIQQYQFYTCLTFPQRTFETDYMNFMWDSGCYATSIGYRHGRSNVSLGYGCESTYTAMHEIGHIIGLHHEQSRPDRDQYVRIIKHNIRNPKFGFNFNKASNIDSLGTGYDYRSIMHYSKTAFAKPGTITIRVLRSRYQDVIGNVKGFSKIDIQQINRMYPCSPGCKDNNSQCVGWANHPTANNCIAYGNYMKTECRKSCGLCLTV